MEPSAALLLEKAQETGLELVTCSVAQTPEGFPLKGESEGLRKGGEGCGALASADHRGFRNPHSPPSPCLATTLWALMSSLLPYDNSFLPSDFTQTQLQPPCLNHIPLPFASRTQTRSHHPLASRRHPQEIQVFHTPASPSLVTFPFPLLRGGSLT